MYQQISIAFVLLTAIAPASAGRSYGTLQTERGAVPEGHEIYVVCPPLPDEAIPTTLHQLGATGIVSKHGRYNVEAPANGECTFVVRLHDGLVHTPIISFGNPTRYDFAISRDGHRNVIRRKQ